MTQDVSQGLQVFHVHGFFPAVRLVMIYDNYELISENGYFFNKKSSNVRDIFN